MHFAGARTTGTFYGSVSSGGFRGGGGGGLDSSISPNGSVPFCLPMCN